MALVCNRTCCYLDWGGCLCSHLASSTFWMEVSGANRESDQGFAAGTGVVGLGILAAGSPVRSHAARNYCCGWKALLLFLYLLDDIWCNEVGTSTPTAAVAALTMVLNLSSLSNRIWSQMISWGHLCCSVHAYEGWGVKPTDWVRLSAKMGEGTKSLQYPCRCHQRVSSWVERLHRRHFILHLHTDSCFKKALKIVLLVRKIVGCVSCVPKTTVFFVGHYPLWWVLPLL